MVLKKDIRYLRGSPKKSNNDSDLEAVEAATHSCASAIIVVTNSGSKAIEMWFLTRLLEVEMDAQKWNNDNADAILSLSSSSCLKFCKIGIMSLQFFFLP